MRTSRAFLSVGLCAVVLSGSCGREGPTHVGRPPVVQGFSPAEQVLQTFVGDTLTFSIRAFDPDKTRLRSWFVLGDSSVGEGEEWSYVVDDTGAVEVSAFVSDDTYRARISWSVVRLPAINFPPTIVEFSPIETHPTMIINTNLTFAVEADDPDGDQLFYQFTVDDTLVSTTADFVFRPVRKGPRRVEARVSDGELSSAQVWQLNVTGIPDTIPPAQVIITLAETGVEPGELELEWVAVGKDGMTGIASNYLVRTSPVPIFDDDDWNRASEQPGVPLPIAAGEIMRMTVTELQPARFTHLAVRAVDDFGNLSPLSDTPGLFTRGMRITGIVLDALSLTPMSDVAIKLSIFSTTSDAGGLFELTDLPNIVGNISATEDGVSNDIGTHYDFALPYRVTHLDHVVLYLMPDAPVDTGLYPSFYIFFRAMTDSPTIPPSSEQRRWELPIDLYVTAFVKDGLDYRQTIQSAADEFDGILGTRVFNFVDQEPALGVKVVYLPGLTNDNYQITEFDALFYPVKARIQHRTAYSASTESVLRVIALHELGHALGLNHSGNTSHLMVGGQSPTVSWFADNEIRVFQLRYNLPRGMDMRNFGVE